MSEDLQTWLHDILTCIEEIESYFNIHPKSFSEYQNNSMLRKATERNLEIIGEAMNRILKAYPEIQIDNAKKIVALRNQVIHGYDVVDDANIWSIIINHLPKLEEDIKVLMKQ